MKRLNLLLISSIFVVIVLLLLKGLLYKPTHRLPMMTIQNSTVEYKGKKYIMGLKDIRPYILEKKIGTTTDKKYTVYKIWFTDTNQVIGILFNEKNPKIYFKATIYN